MAIDLGIYAEGVDGDPRVISENEDIVIHECDYTKDTFEKSVDFIWSVEFLEHVKEEFQENYMKTFSNAKHVFITFAPPGKSGNHHVNLKPSSYWKEVFAKYGLMYDEDVSNDIRRHSTMKREFVSNTGMYFRKE